MTVPAIHIFISIPDPSLYSECDSCYGVVLTEIGPLRTMTANLSAEVSLVEANDFTSTLGPFMQRLQEATSNTNALVTFVS